jgi:hypothetical protein
MSDRGTDTKLTREVGALIRTLEDLQDELDPGRRRRLGLPTPRDLLRFTSEVTIPATILVLETNVRVLRLLQRTIRLTTGEAETSTDASSGVRDRATALGRETLRGLDAALADLESTVEGTPSDDEAASLLAEARTLRDEVDARLAAEGELGDASGVEDGESSRRDRERVDVDVEAELQSIKDDIDEGSDPEDRGSDGDDGGPTGTDPGPDGDE